MALICVRSSHRTARTGRGAPRPAPPGCSSWLPTGYRRIRSGCSPQWNTSVALRPAPAWNSTGTARPTSPTGRMASIRALRDAVRARGLEDVFRLHGAVPDGFRLYREASLVCLPSFYEGCSNVICEAAACGVPLVVSDVCDNRQFVINGVTGFLADPQSPETIAEAILRVHRMSSAARREMGRRARAHAEEMFDPARFTDGYVALIERFVRGRPGNRGSVRRTRGAGRETGSLGPACGDL